MRDDATGAVRHVDLYGDQARAVLEHDTLFLALGLGLVYFTALGLMHR
ncbi:hypothetical protein [Streptomyces sp. NPDC021096]